MRILQDFSKTFIQSCFNGTYRSTVSYREIADFGTIVFFSSILKDIRMERSKIRDTDNIRAFYLARFFIEYLLILRQKEVSKSEGKAKEKENGNAEDDDLSLGLVAEMAELESVRWVFMRMRSTMDDKVSCMLSVI
jgi:replication fork protection complex subunit Tof1/Swi1